MADDKTESVENPRAVPKSAGEKTRKDRLRRVRAAANSATARMAPRFNVPGRPRALDPTQEMLDKNVKTILGAGAMHCTVEEVAALLDVSLETLQEFWHRYPEIKERFEEARLTGQASVRRNQFKLSEKSAQMAIFLGEQVLAQRDPYKMRELELREKALQQAEEALALREREVDARERELELKRPADLGSGLPIDINSLSLAQLMQLTARVKQAIERGAGAGLTIDAVRQKDG